MSRNSLTAVVIAQPDLPLDMETLVIEHGLNSEILTAPDFEIIAEKNFCLIAADSVDFIYDTAKQIRSHPSTCYIPLIAATRDREIDILEFLIDSILPLPFGEYEIGAAISEINSINERISQFCSPNTPLGRHEKNWLNLLRYLVSRQVGALVPEWDSNAWQGCRNPLPSILWGAESGEEAEQLELLSQTGLLESVFFDKIHLCPQCLHYNLNFREICPKCLTSNIDQGENIHHYACGFIAPSNKFLSGGKLICPKCRQALKNPGVDYDKPSLEYYCQECGNTAFEAPVSCLCLACGHEFGTNSAQLETIWEYKLTAIGQQVALNGQISRERLKDFLHKQLGVMDYDVFKKFVEVEMGLNQRQKRNHCLIKLKIEETQRLLEDASFYRTWQKIMGDIKGNLRSHDLLTWLGGNEMLALAIDTDEKQARKALDRIHKKIGDSWPQIGLLSECVSLLPDKNWKDLPGIWQI